MKQRGLIVVVLLAATMFSKPAVGSAPCVINSSIASVGQVSTNWCWAANMEFVARLFTCHVHQCNFAEDLYRITYGGGDPDCCPSGGICSFVFPNLGQFKSSLERNGFRLILAPNGDILRAVTASALRNDLVCAGYPVLACFGIASSTMTSGHVGTLCGVDDTASNSNEWLIRTMDPARGFIFPAYVNLLNGAFPGGAWFATLPVSAVNCFDVSISDIGGFWYGAQGSGAIELLSRINHTANPDDSLALYVADNPLGPARKFKTLKPISSPAPEGGVVVSYYDDQRLDDETSYFYFLDHGPGGFASLIAPTNLLENGDNPILKEDVTTPWSERPVLDAPEILGIVDESPNRGDEVVIQLEPSSDDSVVDYYNIYRKSDFSGFSDGYKWVGTAPRGTTSFEDVPTIPGVSYSYLVAAAHHGNHTSSDGGNLGIWNDFGNEESVTPVDEYAFHELVSPVEDTLIVCPQESASIEPLVIGLLLKTSTNEPSRYVPREMLNVRVSGDSCTVCGGDTVMADADTDSLGRTQFVISGAGGHGRVSIVAGVVGDLAAKDSSTVYIKSPDVTGDGRVDVTDFALLGSSYTAPPKTYKWYWDFAGTDQNVNISDYAYWSSHYNHKCATYGQVAEAAPASSAAGVALDVVEVIASPESRLLRVEVSMSDMPRFSGACVFLRSDNPRLRYLRWERGDFQGRTLVSPIVRDGVSEISIGVLDGEKSTGTSLHLGWLVFSIIGEAPLNLSSNDFESRVAELAAVGGRLLTMSASSPEDTRRVSRLVSNSLSQNHPNPFNPTTTISYSIAQSGPVTLTVFAVDGSLVRVLVNATQSPNSYVATWDGTDAQGERAATGVYFYRLKANGFSETKKMVLLK